MPGTPTANYGIQTMDGAADIGASIDDTHNAAMATIDAKMTGYSSGLLSARPVSTPGSPGVGGRLYRATDTGQVFQDTGTSWDEIQGAGDLKPTARATAPDGWLLCNGALVSKTTYAALFAAIGHFFNGTVDPGGGNFKLPDFRGRVPTGVDGTAGRITAFYGLGQTGGSETHTLTVAQMPSHAHVQRWAASPASGVFATPSWGGDLDTDTVSSPFSTDPTGGGGSHNNLQPYQNVNWLIKT